MERKFHSTLTGEITLKTVAIHNTTQSVFPFWSPDFLPWEGKCSLNNPSQNLQRAISILPIEWGTFIFLRKVRKNERAKFHISDMFPKLCSQTPEIPAPSSRGFSTQFSVSSPILCKSFWHVYVSRDPNFHPTELKGLQWQPCLHSWTWDRLQS